jgi:hypothetical protein
MSHDLLDRLLAALARNPHLEFKVWVAMRGIRFYGPWQPMRWGEGWVIQDYQGKVVGGVDVQIQGYLPYIPNSASLPQVQHLDEALRAVETELVAHGWKRAPDELWSIQEQPSGISPWEQDDDGSWLRFVLASREVIATVSRVNPDSLHNFEYAGVVYQLPANTIVYQTVYSSENKAKHNVDRVLFSNGQIQFEDMAPDPDLPV